MPWVVFHRARARARVRLYCLPFAGGGARSYRLWREELPWEIELASIQLPGRENRIGEQPFEHIEDLVRAATEGLVSSLSEVPFAVFGHSFGTIVALEIVRRLQTHYSLCPSHLIVAGRPAPHVPLRHVLAPGMSAEEMKEWLRRLNGTPDSALANRDLMELILPALRADLEMNHYYRARAKPLIACPLTVMGGREDEETEPEHLRAWSSYTSSRFATHVLEGNHFFPFNECRSAALKVIANALLLGETTCVLNV